MRTGDLSKAHFLAAILNSPVVDIAIKDAQTKGLWGPRHVCKKVLDLPIPSYSEAHGDHVRLAEIGKACAKRVAHWIASGGPGEVTSIGVLRNRVRELLQDELGEIDAIVKPMLGL